MYRPCNKIDCMNLLISIPPTNHNLQHFAVELLFKVLLQMFDGVVMNKQLIVIGGLLSTVMGFTLQCSIKC